MKKKLTAVLSFLFTISVLASCGAQNTETASDLKSEETTVSVTETVSETSETEAPAESSAEAESVTEQVTAPPVEVGFEGMEPVYADSIADGVYDITVDSSSSMFNITSCELTVSEGKMTAAMTMGGTGYAYVFMGTGEEAASAADDELIEYTENENGEHVFTVPVEALNQKTDCSAFSKKKEQWYDRVLVFRADTLPLDVYASETMTTAESLGLEDGQYTADVTLAGGSGRASVESPALITVKDGKTSAKIIWSSKNYDYMIVEGEKYLPLEDEENSAFEIPVAGFDFALPVSADTTAMSTPHEIEYTLTFDSSSVVKNED